MVKRVYTYSNGCHGDQRRLQEGERKPRMKSGLDRKPRAPFLLAKVSSRAFLPLH